MARITCKCGFLLSASQAPNDIQLRVYTDREWESIFEKEVINYGEVPVPSYNVLQCPECSRLYFFRARNDEVAQVYMLEK